MSPAQVLLSRPSGRRRKSALVGEALPRGKIVRADEDFVSRSISDASAALLDQALEVRLPDVLT
jgi:hypothetical protein